MTAINRTAYPYFKQFPSPEELANLYTPTAEELELARSHVRLASSRLSFLVLLKSFQRLGYFPAADSIPETVIAHLRQCLHLDRSMSGTAPHASRYRYYRIIRGGVVQK